MIEPNTRKLLIVIALLAWIASYPLLQAIYRNPGYHAEYTEAVMDVRAGGTEAIMAMLGGFRSIAANMLWLKSDQYWHQGGAGWWRMLPVLRTITRLDPHFINAWDTLGWHCAYNLQSDAIPEDKPKWIQAGVDAFQDGIRANPNRYELYASLAWLYHDRLKDYHQAIPVWQQVVGFKDAPLASAHMLAHAYERTWQIDKAVAVWKACLAKHKYDPVAESAIEWWAKHRNDKAYLISLWQRENKLRHGVGLPPIPRPDQAPAARK